MSANSKSIVLSIVSFAISLLVFSLIIEKHIPAGMDFFRTVMIVVSAFVFTPKRQVVKKQSGTEYHMKWLFSRRIIVFK